MKRDLFDDIGNKLSRYESPVDFSEEWEGIAAKQAQSRKRRLLLCWLSVIMILLFSSIYLIQRNDAQRELATQSEVASNAAEVETQALANLVDSESRVEASATSMVESEEQEVLSNSIVSQWPKQSKQAIQSTIQSTIQTIEKSTLPIDEHTEEVAFTPDNQNVREPLSGNFPSRIRNQSVAPLTIATIDFDDFYSSDMLEKIKRLQKLKRTNSPKKLSKKKVQLFANVGLAFTQQQFSPRTSADEALSQLRNTVEQPLETYTYQLGVNVFLKEKSFLSFSGHYNLGFDRIEYQYEAPKSFAFENVLLRRLTFSNGEVQEIFGDTTLMGSQTVRETQYNTYTTFSISASFGHYLFQKEKVQLAIIAGLLQNISFNAEGKTVDPENLNGPLVALSGYRGAYGLAFLGGMDLDYQMSKNLFLNIRPSFGYDLFSITQSDYPLKVRRIQYGLSAGLKYGF
ncbi:MAG: hypothetical protein AAF985_01925 [Bacteroidota bacterium]